LVYEETIFLWGVMFIVPDLAQIIWDTVVFSYFYITCG
jgi:hypothetical protein